MKREQLSLPKLRVPEEGPVSIVLFLKDADTRNPKVLMAQRPNGRWTFPGGKLRFREFRRPARGARREMLEETGIKIYDEECLIESHRSPMRVAVDGKERTIHFFYAFSDESADSDIPIHRELKKNTPWSYIPLRDLPRLVAVGRLHKIAVNTAIDIIANESLELVDEIRIEADRERKSSLLSLHRRGLLQDSGNEYGFLEYIHDRDAARYASSLRT